jgi:hypothetical protein
LHVRDVDLAGARVRLRLVGDALAECLIETFAHLQASPLPSSPGLQIDAWAEDETGEPGLPLGPPVVGAVESPMDGGLLAISADEQYLSYRVGNNSVSWLDRRASHIVASVRRSNDLLLRERVKPFGTLVPLWLRDRGIRVMHAAAVADGQRAVILPGPSGAGKSTCATFCVEAGLRYLGDDAVGLQERNDGSFVVHSLYGGARLWPADGGFFPDWSTHAMHPDSAGDEPKLLLFVGRRHRERFLSQADIAAIVFPRVTTHTETRLRPLARAEALRALVSSSLFLGVKPDAIDIDQMLRLVTRLPTFALDLGADRSQIPNLVERCLRTTGLTSYGCER